MIGSNLQVVQETQRGRLFLPDQPPPSCALVMFFPLEDRPVIATPPDYSDKTSLKCCWRNTNISVLPPQMPSAASVLLPASRRTHVYTCIEVVFLRSTPTLHIYMYTYINQL